MPISVTPIHKKYWKSAHLVRDEGASQREQDKEADKADYCKERPQEQEEEERQPLIREKEEEKLIMRQ